MLDRFYYNYTMPLVAYHQKSKLAQTSTLFSDLEVPTQQPDEDVVEPYLPYLKPEVCGYVVFDSEVYDGAMTSSNVFYTAMIRSDKMTGLYIPLTYLSDFWVLMKELIEVEPESDKRTVTIRAGTQHKNHYGY